MVFEKIFTVFSLAPSAKNKIIHKGVQNPQMETCNVTSMKTSRAFAPMVKTLHTRIEHSNSRFLFDEQPDTYQLSIMIHAGAFFVIPVSFCYVSVYQNRLNSKTAFAKQNEGLVTGEAFMKMRRTLHLDLFPHSQTELKL
ncbi:hypothetical protein GH733_014715 [Mirounga leonina]|nr:hypothetical protein GH733_014715 [Mirounga leonina]